MRLLDFSIEDRGFELAAISIAIRTLGSCYAMCFRPDDRPLIGVGLFTVRTQGDSILFDTAAKAIGEGEMPADLLDWLEPQLAAEDAVVSWDRRLAVSTRLKTIADPERHPNLVAAAGDSHGRWRDLPRSMTWHLTQATAPALPCLCPPGGMASCRAELPAALLPDQEDTERQLEAEAADGWIVWANLFGDFDDHSHPAHRALRALVERRACERARSARPRRA